MTGRDERAIRTLGHGSLPLEDFAALLGGAGVDLVIDVRRYPGSRRVPHYGQKQMSAWLADHGIAYRWLAALGGRRETLPESPNVALRNEQFRAYADHMATQEFHEAVADLLALSADSSPAVMCAEAVWWRCHRRLLADHLVLIERRAVEHLFHDGRLQAHPVTPQARRAGGHLVYDAEG